MAYEKQSWVDGQTVLDSSRMEHLEDGIAAARDGLATEEYVNVALAGVPQPIVPREPGARYRFVAGAIRKVGGVWSLINDAGHVPSNIVSVTDRGTDLRIEYGFTATKVVSLVATPDETYNVLGYSFGASVGLDGSTIKIMNSKVMTAGGYVAYGAGGWTSATGNITGFELRPNPHEIRVYHPEPTPATDIYLSITGRGPGKYVYRSEGSGSSGGSGYTTVGIYDMAGNPVTAFASDMKFFIVRQSNPSAEQIAPSALPEGLSNIWIYGIMEI